MNMENKSVISGFLKTGFILAGIAIMVSAISYIFLDLFLIAALGSLYPSFSLYSVLPEGALVQMLSDIFLLILGIIIIRIASGENYFKTRRLGEIFIVTFIILGVSDLIASTLYTTKTYQSYDSSISKYITLANPFYSKSFGSSLELYGILLIIGGIFVGTALIMITNKNKTTNFISAILGIIGSIFIFYAIFSVPGKIATSNHFVATVSYSWSIPSHIYSVFGFFGSWEYLALIGGLIFAVSVILMNMDIIKEKLFLILNVFALLLFSIGTILLGITILSTKSITDFSNTNPLYIHMIFSGAHSSNVLLLLLHIFQFLIIPSSILILIGGALILVFALRYVIMLFFGNISIKPVSSGNIVHHKEASETEDNTKSTSPDPTNNIIAIKLRDLQQMLKEGAITEDYYNKRKEELLKEL